jgi:hypothetical protein
MKYRKKKIQAIYDSVDIENRLPIFTQNVQTNISFQINIWMVHLHVHRKWFTGQKGKEFQQRMKKIEETVLYLGLALNLWRLVRIRRGHLKGENETSSLKK